MRRTWDVDILDQGFHITYIMYIHYCIIYICIHSPVCKNIFILFNIGISNNSDISASICRDTCFIKYQKQFWIKSLNVLPVFLNTPTFFFYSSFNKPVTNPYHHHCDWYVIEVCLVVVACAIKVFIFIFPSAWDLVNTWQSNWSLVCFRSSVIFISWIESMASERLMLLLPWSDQTSTMPINKYQHHSEVCCSSQHRYQSIDALTSHHGSIYTTGSSPRCPLWSHSLVHTKINPYFVGIGTICDAELTCKFRPGSSLCT